MADRPWGKAEECVAGTKIKRRRTPLHCPDDVRRYAAWVTRAIKSGRITASQGNAMSNALRVTLVALAAGDSMDRVAAVEEMLVSLRAQIVKERAEREQAVGEVAAERIRQRQFEAQHAVRQNREPL
jgi:hypothetical protein